MGATGTAIPDFGNVLRRDRLVRLFERRAPALTILAAPSGYGKSVVAAQFAALPRFGTSYWVNLGDRGGTEEDMLAGFVAAVESHSGDENPARGGLAIPSESVRSEWMLSLLEQMGSHEGQAVCVVLDGADTLADVEAMRRLAAALQSWTSLDTRLVITCRDLESDVPVSAGSEWVIEDLDLRFTHPELKMLVYEWLGETPDDAFAGALLERSGGQPALAGLMISHPEVDIDGPLTRDLVWYTRRTLGNLGAPSIRALYVAAVLQTGELPELDACMLSGGAQVDWFALGRAVPLFRVAEDVVPARTRFGVHAALRQVAIHDAGAVIDPDELAQLRHRIVEHLICTRDYSRAVGALNSACSQAELLRWCESAGMEILQHVGPTTMAECISRVPPVAMSSSQRMLLLNAWVLRQQERIDEALAYAVLARRLAECEGDDPLRVESAMLIARLELDRGRFQEVPSILSDVTSVATSTSQQCLLDAYMAVALAVGGERELAIERITRVEHMINKLDVSCEARASAVNAIGAIEGMCCGRWSVVEPELAVLASCGGLSPLQRALMRANQAAALAELGLVRDCRPLVVDVLNELERSGLDHLRGFALGTVALAEAACNDLGSSDKAFSECCDLLASKADQRGLGLHRAVHSVVVRAFGDAERALALAQRAEGALATPGGTVDLLHLMARIEIAASLAALGDVRGARVVAESVVQAISAPDYWAHHLKADLVLAECDRLSGSTSDAVSRLERYAEYVSTGSLNLQTALYIRAFPAMLPMLAAAIGVDTLPARMLALITPDAARDALRVAPDVLGPSDVDALRSRLESITATGQSATVDGAPADSGPYCRVQLFGGLRVVTDRGVVEDIAWRKRKARGMFLMLVLRRGQDVSRDLLLDTLWPDLCPQSQRNNYYVTWGDMRRVLSGSDAPERSDHYVHSAGGLCRITPCVTSDLDDLDDATARLRAADQAGDAESVMAAAREVAQVYRGEFLPGDMYEDSFREIRDRARQDFCASMLKAGLFFEVRRDFESALEFLRKASSTDQWREDVYQAIMRCSMHSGRRSGAIETFMACRSKLTEDLGIDPSSETMRLYEAILAMDSEPETPYGE